MASLRTSQLAAGTVRSLLRSVYFLTFAVDALKSNASYAILLPCNVNILTRSEVVYYNNANYVA